MARIPYADAPQYTPGTPEYTMGQEQRRQAKADESEIHMLNAELIEMMRDPSLSSSDRQEVSELMDDIHFSEFGLQEATPGMGPFLKGVGQALGKQAKGAKAKILGGARTTAQGIKDRFKTLTDRLRPKVEPGPKSKAKDRVYPEWLKTDPNKLRWSSMTEAERAASRAASSAKGLATKAKTAKVKTAKDMAKGGAIVGGAGLIGSEFLDQAGGDEEPQDEAITPEVSPEVPPEASPEVSPERPGPSAVEDTRTPRQKRKFLPRGPGPGARSGSPGRMNPDYIPPPGEETPEQSPTPPMTPVPDVPGEPRLDEVMPELANGFTPAKRSTTNVVTDQRIGDPSGLDVFRKKPQPGTQPVRPELPVTGVPEDQPETIPDMTPTDQDIEGLFNGEGMPERLQDDPSKDAVSAAFKRERAEAFGRPQDVSQEPGGIPFSDTPEGQEFAAGDVMPPELVKPDYMSDEVWAILSDAEKRQAMKESNTSFANTFGAGTQ